MSSGNPTDQLRKEKLQAKPNSPNLIVISLICFLVSIGFSPATWSATYFVDASSGNDGNPGTIQTTPWKTIAKVNGSQFQPGDQVLFRRGETWRETLSPQTPGEANNPIKFGAYGTGAKPIISGANIVKGFVKDPQANVWSAMITTAPQVVIFNSSNGIKTSTKVDLDGLNKWYWVSNVLYVYSVGNPDNLYTSPGLQVGTRNWGIVAGKNYLLFENFIVEGANSTNITIVGNGTRGCTFSFCESRFGVLGILLFDTTLGGGHVIKNCEVRDNRGTGINGFKHIGSTKGNESFIQNNQVYNNQEAGIVWRGNYGVIERNLVHDNGNASSPYMGIHIYSGAMDEGTGDHNIIRFNKVYNQLGNGEDGAGISSDQWCDNNEIYYNVVFNNDGPGIYLFDSANCKIFNNVCYANCKNSSGQLTEKGEIRITSSGVPNNLTRFAEVKNNIGYATRLGTYAVYVDSETAAYLPVISNNLWYREDAANWYYWGNSSGKDLITWRNLSGAASDLKSNPNFLNAAIQDFHLQAGSPCIDTEINVSLALDYDNNPVSLGINPDIGAFEFNPYKPLPPWDIRIY